MQFLSDFTCNSQKPLWNEKCYHNLCVLLPRLCPTLCDPMDCSPPGSSVLEIPQARILEWVAMPSSRGSSRAMYRTRVSCIASRFFTFWDTREVYRCINWGLGDVCELESTHYSPPLFYSSKVLKLELEPRQFVSYPFVLYFSQVKGKGNLKNWMDLPPLWFLKIIVDSLHCSFPGDFGKLIKNETNRT